MCSHQLADALQGAFTEIRLGEAATLLLLDPSQMPQLVHFCQQRGWSIEGDCLRFSPASSLGVREQLEVSAEQQARELIVQAMGYAAQFQQIV